MASAYFADTSFWLALSSRRDQFHARALAWSDYLVRTKIPIITTEAVLWEWMNALADPAVRRTAAEGYRRCHGDPQVEVVPFGGEAIESAVWLYEARGTRVGA